MSPAGNELYSDNTLSDMFLSIALISVLLLEKDKFWYYALPNLIPSIHSFVECKFASTRVGKPG